jgi:hypothetical protein
MNTKDFRAAINGEIVAWGAANFPALPLIFENGPLVDQDKIGPVFLDTELRWYAGTPLSVGSGQSGRHSGVISLMLYSRSAQGSGGADDILDSLEPLLSRRRIGTAVVNFPQRTIPTNLVGWYKTGLLFPFTLDR